MYINENIVDKNTHGSVDWYGAGRKWGDLKMDMNVLKTFVAVCEYSGFSAAGEKLGYTQSTVSSQIKQLEKEVGAVLFDRIRHNVQMTEDGATVLRYAQKMLALQAQMEEELHHKDRIEGQLRLAMASSIGARFFSRDLLAFHQRYPFIRIKSIECGTEEMFELLRRNEVDIVFTLDTHIFDPEFTICGEAMEQVHFVTSADHPLTKLRTIQLANLIRHPFILTEKNMSYRKVFDQRLSENSLEIQPLFEVGSSDQICRFLSESEAVSLLPDFVTQKYVEKGLLERLPVEDCEINVWTQILVHRNKWISPVMWAFIEFYKEVLRG